MKLRQQLLGVLAISALAVPAAAAPFQNATIRRIVDGKEVFIDKKPARIQQTAGHGQELSTGKSRAELLFDRRALGFLGTNSLIRLGEECFRLDKGQVLINGPQSGCLGSKVLGIRGTTYVLNALNEGGYRLSVLSGAASISEEKTPTSGENAPDILEQYPRLNPVIGFGSSAWGSNAKGETLGQAAGLILGDASFFVPLSQSDGSKLLYNYSTASSNFDNAWGASTEFGYKWFDPNNRSITSLLVGYDGWESPGCFHSQLAVGGQWQKGRWQFGATGGVPIDGCDNNLGFAIGQLGIPVVNLGEQSVLLSLSPYVMHGIGNTYGGGRLGLNVPVGENVSLSAFGQYDELLDTVVGGQISYRFSTNGGFINDPNLQRQTLAAPIPWQAGEFKSEHPIQLAVGGDMSVLGQMITAPSEAVSEQLTPTKSGITIKAGEEAVLDSDGRLISKNAMSRERFSQLIQETMEGQNLLPESHMIGVVYQQLYGLPNQELLSILGSDWLIAARRPYPRLRGTNNLVIPDNKLPKEEAEETVSEAIVLTYVCKAYGNSPAFDYYNGQAWGGSLAEATRFTTTSKESATCSGKKAGSTGDDPTSPNFL